MDVNRSFQINKTQSNHISTHGFSTDPDKLLFNSVSTPGSQRIQNNLSGEDKKFIDSYIKDPDKYLACFNGNMGIPENAAFFLHGRLAAITGRDFPDPQTVEALKDFFTSVKNGGGDANHDGNIDAYDVIDVFTKPR